MQEAPARQSAPKQIYRSGRVLAYYHRLLSRIVGRSKRTTTPARSDIECMRMCVDAADGKRSAA